MANRRRNPRLAKSLRSYTIADAADLYGAHRQTVRQWLANGLQPIDASRPIMIHGTELNRFHAQRREANKRCCGVGELYCLGCRAPRAPAGDMVDFVPVSDKVGTIAAICPVCERVMTQRVNASRLAAFEAVFHVATRPPPKPLDGSA